MRVKSCVIGVAALLLSGLGAVAPAAAETPLIARVDVSDQKMYVYIETRLAYTRPVSTGRRAFDTPTGQYKPEWVASMWRSRKYNNAPMPYSVFFHEGYAVHGTTEVSDLGKPASHGCVRLHPDNAKALFALVRQYGPSTVRVSIER